MLHSFSLQKIHSEEFNFWNFFTVVSCSTAILIYFCDICNMIKGVLRRILKLPNRIHNDIICGIVGNVTWLQDRGFDKFIVNMINLKIEL